MAKNFSRSKMFKMPDEKRRKEIRQMFFDYFAEKGSK